MKIRNYLWKGFGFPVIFAELPAIKVRGELIPDVDWGAIAPPLVTFICTHQDIPLSGNQVKFFRHFLSMSLREFARFVGVTHQSLMRWEEKGNQPAKVEAHIEIVLRLKILRKIGSEDEQINEVMEQADDMERFRSSTYRTFSPLKVPEAVTHGC